MFGQDTTVLGVMKRVPIEELYQSHLRTNHSRRLKSFNTQIGKWTKAKLCLARKAFREGLVRIYLENGMTLVVTPKQSLWTDKGRLIIQDIKLPIKSEYIYKYVEHNIAIRKAGNIAYSRLIRIAPAPPQHVYEVRMHKSYYTYVVDGFILCNLKVINGKRKEGRGTGALEGIGPQAAEGSSGAEEAVPKKKQKRRPRGPQRWIWRRRRPGEPAW